MSGPTREQFKIGLAASVIIGTVLAIAAIALFGVMDVQCPAEAPYWHVDARHQAGICLPYEVNTGPEKPHD